MLNIKQCFFVVLSRIFVVKVVSHAFCPDERVGRSFLLLAKKSIVLVKDSLSRSAREMELSLATPP